MTPVLRLIETRERAVELYLRLRNIEKEEKCSFADLLAGGEQMIIDPELVQTAIIRNHLTVSERMLRETGFEKEHVLEAY